MKNLSWIRLKIVNRKKDMIMIMVMIRVMMRMRIMMTMMVVMMMMMRTMLSYLIDPIFLHLCVVCQPRPDWTRHKISFFVKYFDVQFQYSEYHFCQIGRGTK